MLIAKDVLSCTSILCDKMGSIQILPEDLERNYDRYQNPSGPFPTSAASLRSPPYVPPDLHRATQTAARASPSSPFHAVRGAHAGETQQLQLQLQVRETLRPIGFIARVMVKLWFRFQVTFFLRLMLMFLSLVNCG